MPSAGEGEVTTNFGYFWIPVAKIARYAGQPRQFFNPEEMNSLVASIADQGQLEPIKVKRLEDTHVGMLYMLVDGERRWRAHKILGLSHLKTTFVTPADEHEHYLLSVISNVHRAEHTPLEYAEIIRRLWGHPQFAQLSDSKKYENIARVLGKSVRAVQIYHALLKLCPEVKVRLDPTITPKEMRLGTTQAAFISNAPSHAEQIHLTQVCVANRFSMRELEEHARSRAAREGFEMRGTATRKPADDFWMVRGTISSMRRGVDLVRGLDKARFKELYAKRSPRERAEDLRQLETISRRVADLAEVLRDFHDELK